MQCAYALLMVLNKTLLMYPDSLNRGPLVDNMIAQLQGGLRSISSTLENYATAFEALGGMRGMFFVHLSATYPVATRANHACLPDQIRSVIEPSVEFRGD